MPSVRNIVIVTQLSVERAVSWASEDIQEIVLKEKLKEKKGTIGSQNKLSRIKVTNAVAIIA